MMYTNIFVWSVLLAISVSDAKAHRIPNNLLLLLLVSSCLSTLVHTPQEVLWSVFFNKFSAFGIGFAFALVLHLIRVMAPGDVKLIAVLGLFLGTAELIPYLYYVCLITVFVGPMYWLLNQLQFALNSGAHMDDTELSKRINLTGMVVSIQLNQQALKKRVSTGNDLTYMPFAPILVMGLALHQYYS